MIMLWQLLYIFVIILVTIVATLRPITIMFETIQLEIMSFSALLLSYIFPK